jgi:hypothetical protein
MFPIQQYNNLLNDVIQSYGNNPGQILNWPGELYDERFLSNTPEMIGRGGIPGLQESHIFLLPVWDEKSNPIDWDLVSKYNDVINKFNTHMINTYPNWKPMKNPLLALNFIEQGYLTVMQSSLYLINDNKRDIVNCTHQLANLFKTAGFTVVREKIEATVYGIDGIPITNQDACKYSGYFEFHIRVESKSVNGLGLGLGSGDKIPLDQQELILLDTISKEFQTKFDIPVPISFNRSTHLDGGYQRYLNVRFRNTGSIEALGKVKEITSRINDSTNLKVIKVISEYVWYDTFVELDKGWIDF